MFKVIICDLEAVAQPGRAEKKFRRYALVIVINLTRFFDPAISIISYAVTICDHILPSHHNLQPHPVVL